MKNTIESSAIEPKNLQGISLELKGWKHFICILIAAIAGTTKAIACEACKKQQPKFFQGITHGAGPSSNWDYVIVTLMTIITLYTLYATIKRMIRPAENENSHIKRMIFNQ